MDAPGIESRRFMTIVSPRERLLVIWSHAQRKTRNRAASWGADAHDRKRMGKNGWPLPTGEPKSPTRDGCAHLQERKHTG